MYRKIFLSNRRIHMLLALMLFSFGCSSSGSSGCSCAKPIPGGFPAAKKISNIVQLKITKRGTDFIGKNNSLLIKQFLPNGLTFDIPRSNSSSVEVCRNPPCRILGKINKLDLGLVPSNKVRASLWLDIKTQRDMEVRVKQKVGFFKIRVTCKVSLNIRNKRITSDITLGTHKFNKGLTFAVGQPSFSLSSSDFKIKGKILCKVVNVLKGLFKGLIEKQAKKAIGSALSGFTCMKCKKAADCPSGSSCSGGKCVQGGACLPIPMGTEGAMDMSSLLSGFGNKNSSDLLFAAFMGGRAQVKTSGIELGMLGGTDAKDHPCVAKKPFPKMPAPALLPFSGTSPNGKPYMVGIGISDVMMKSFARDLYRSGGLCLRLDSSASSSLGSVFSAQGIGALFTSLTTLVGSENPPLYIGLRPSVPPVIDIGKGTTTKDAKGKTVIKDPLLELTIPALNFDFMMKYHDRWIRLFTYQSDIVLPLVLTVKPGNKLGLVMGELGSAMKNPKVKNSYILGEKPADIATTLFSTLKAVLPLAAGSLGNQEFAVPALQGFKLSITGITGVIPRKDKPNRFKFLALFADLGIAPPSKPLLPEVQIGMRLVRLNVPSRFYQDLRNHRPLHKYPSAIVELQDPRSDREYSFRFNGGIWSPYTSGSRHVLESAQMMFQGKHLIEVRSRSALVHAAEDFGFGELVVRVDFTPPHVTLKKVDRGIMPMVKDNMTLANDLRTEYRFGQTNWQWLSPGQSINTVGLENGTVVQVRTTDKDGNTKMSQMTIHHPTIDRPKPLNTAKPVASAQRQIQAPSTQEPQPKALGCSQWSLGGSLNGLFLFLIGFGLFFLRRRNASVQW